MVVILSFLRVCMCVCVSFLCFIGRILDGISECHLFRHCLRDGCGLGLFVGDALVPHLV